MNALIKEKLDFIINLTKYIEEIYNKLYDLEIKGKKETLEYSSLISDLQRNIINEQNLYYNLNIMDYLEIDDYLKKEWRCNYHNEREHILKCQDNNNFKYRIYKQLKKKIDAYFLLLTNIDKIDQIKPIDFYKQTIAKPNFFEKDLFTAFLSFLEDEINNVENNDIKNDLVKIKYNVGMISFGIEKMLVDQDFKLNKVFYVYGELLENENNFEDLLMQIANYQIYCFETFENKKDLTNKEKTILILRSCMLRSTFMFMDKEIVTDFTFDIYNEKEFNPEVDLILKNSIKKIKNDLKSVKRIIKIKEINK